MVTDGALLPWTVHLPPAGPAGANDGPAGTVDLAAGSTLVRAWVDGWARRPDARVLADLDPTTGAARWWTSARLEEASRVAAGRLTRAGLRPGDRVLWSTGSSVEAVVAHVGALRAGLVVVPANTAYTAGELAHLVAVARPGAAVMDDPARLPDGGLRPPVVVGPGLAGLPDAGPDDAALLDAALLDRAGPDDPALLCFTSGTTGPPKAAVLRHRHLLAATRAVTLAWRWGPEDRLVHCLPIFHAHGLCVGVYGTLLAGGSALLLPGFDPAAVAGAAADPGASLFFGVPTMYHRLLAAGRTGDLAGLRLCVSGSAPLAADLHRAVSTALRSPVLERYGMTETLMNVSNPYDGERRPGTVGIPLPRVEVVLAPDGEILVRGPNVFDGYWEAPAATDDAFLADPGGGDPWFRTGDLGEVDRGYLVIRGRSKELIISGGYNIHPTEVEDVLVAHPRVAEVAVTGTPSEEWGEVVTAWVVPDGEAPTADDLAAFAAGRLAPYKRPRLVRVVEALPRNALGKIVRGDLGG